MRVEGDIIVKEGAQSEGGEGGRRSVKPALRTSLSEDGSPRADV